jgi:NAD(P)H-hydrate epimerase
MILPLAIDTAQLDAATCRAQHITSYELMERAAGRAADIIRTHYPNRRTRFMAMVGPGNNGGDALVIVRRLYEAGYPVTAFLYAPKEHCSTDCETALQQLPKGILNQVSTHMELPELTADDVLIDGLFGSGLNRALSGGYDYLVAWMNNSAAQVVSIDLPSGLFADRYSHEDASMVVRADYTLIIGKPKLCCYLPECAEFLGDWQVVDIDLVPTDGLTLASPHRLLTRADASALYRPRPRFSHKGTYGHAALVAGSRGMEGAAVLAASACMRSGVGLLTVYTPACGYHILQTTVPEAKCTTAGSDHLTPFDLPGGHDAVGIGPGIGTAHDTAQLLHRLLEAASRPMVLDADALNLLAAHPHWWRLLPPQTILTPHPKEADRLLASAYTVGYLHDTVSASPDAMARRTSSSDRLARVRALAREARLVIVLKGAYTVIALPSGELWWNVEHGHSGMAVGGSGDTLTGIILALLAAHYPPADAARLGVYLHSAAADAALTEQSEESWCPSDLIHALGRGWKMIKGERDEV